MQIKKKNILILGASGMLGHTLLVDFSRREHFSVHATARNHAGLERWLAPELPARIHTPVDANDFAAVEDVLKKVQPDVVINCIGIIKQQAAAKDPLACIGINALFPHRLANECVRFGARLIHMSTDCVFSGKNGNYTENDFPDCDDLYGRSKLLGEVDYPHAVTLRTSIIGHELNTHVSLIDWFLTQQERVKGFTKAIYSGFPTVEMARIIAEVVIPRPELHGLYHVSSTPISKYNLLCLVREIYGKEIEIEPFDDFYCDRSLDSSRFRNITGYIPPSWEELVTKMHKDYWRLRNNR